MKRLPPRVNAVYKLQIASLIFVVTAILSSVSVAQQDTQEVMLRIVRELDRAREGRDPAAAAAAAQKLLDIDLPELGFELKDIWEIQAEVAETFADAGRLDEAIGVYWAILDEVKTTKGVAEPEKVVDWYLLLAELQEQAGDLLGALASLRAAYDIEVQYLGPEYPEVRFTLERELDFIRPRLKARDLVSEVLTRLKATAGKLDRKIRVLEKIADRERNPLVTLGAEPDDAPYERVRVFFASNRNRTESKDPDRAFGDRRGPLSYGYADVTVPRQRELGTLGRASIFSFRKGTQDEETVVLKYVHPLDGADSFVKSFNDAMARGKSVGASGAEAFVYVHGHDTTFSDAARRTAQLAVDLDMKTGGLFYTWPAGGLLKYLVSERQVTDQHVRGFKSFLRLITERTDAERVHVIAHSMGNRFLRRALREMALADGVTPMLDQVIWASPDVDASEFVASIEGDKTAHIPSILGFANGMTLYASDKDRALKLSRRLGGDYLRAGEVRDPLPVIVDGLTTVDTTLVAAGVTGHADYVGSAFNDLRAVVWFSLAPNARCVLEARQHANGKAYWIAKTDKDGCIDSDFRRAINVIRKFGREKSLILLEDVQDKTYRRALPIARNILMSFQ